MHNTIPRLRSSTRMCIDINKQKCCHDPFDMIFAGELEIGNVHFCALPCLISL